MAASFIDSNKYNLNKERLIDNVRKALEECKFKIKYIDEENGIIFAKSRLSIWSWTEEIDIKIKDDGLVIIKSECALPTTIFDWGKNKRNVKRIFTALDNL